MATNNLDREATEGLETAQRMLDNSHTAEYRGLNLDEQAKVDEVVRYVMGRIRSLMEGQGLFKTALRAALKPRYREFLEKVVAAKITEGQMTVVLAEVWKQTREILDRTFDGKDWRTGAGEMLAGSERVKLFKVVVQEL